MNIDLAPTFLDMAGLSSTPEQMDGLSLSPFFSASSNKTWGRSTILIEHQGEFHENTPGCPQFREQNMSVRIRDEKMLLHTLEYVWSPESLMLSYYFWKLILPGNFGVKQ